MTGMETDWPNPNPVAFCDLWCPTCETVVAVNYTADAYEAPVPVAVHDHPCRVRRARGYPGQVEMRETAETAVTFDERGMPVIGAP